MLLVILECYSARFESSMIELGMSKAFKKSPVDDLSLARAEAVVFLEPGTLVVKTYGEPVLHSTSYLFMTIVICVIFAGLLGSLLSVEF